MFFSSNFLRFFSFFLVLSCLIKWTAVFYNEHVIKIKKRTKKIATKILEYFVLYFILSMITTFFFSGDIETYTLYHVCRSVFLSVPSSFHLYYNILFVIFSFHVFFWILFLWLKFFLCCLLVLLGLSPLSWLQL